MDLKDFIKEFINAITNATNELKSELYETGVIINPPTNGGSNNTFEVGGTQHTLRRVQNIEFDLALTTSTSTTGGGKGGLKIFVVEANVGVTHARTNEEASRVKFSIPLALPPSQLEAVNRQAAHNARYPLVPQR